MSSEEKLASIRARIDRLSQWLKEQEASDEAPAQDDQLAAFKTAFEDVKADKVREQAAKIGWGDVVAAASDEAPPPSESATKSLAKPKTKAKAKEDGAGGDMVKNPALNETAGEEAAEEKSDPSED